MKVLFLAIALTVFVAGCATDEGNVATNAQTAAPTHDRFRPIATYFYEDMPAYRRR